MSQLELMWSRLQLTMKEYWSITLSAQKQQVPSLPASLPQLPCPSATTFSGRACVARELVQRARLAAGLERLLPQSPWHQQLAAPTN